MTKARSNATAEAAKGDLRVGNGTNLSGILGVGSTGDTIVADSSTSTGLRYTAGTVVANPILNAACEIAQRGTAALASNAALNQFMTDRFNVFRAVAGATWTRQNTNDTTNLPNIRYCIRAARDSGNSATNAIYVLQNIETLNTIPFAGKTVTFSFYARAGANYSASGSVLAVGLSTGTGTDQNVLAGYTGSTNPILTSATLTTTWQRFSFTGTIPTNATEMAAVTNSAPTGTAGANDYYEITGFQIDIGSVALPFRTNGGTIQGELAACQRYYFRTSPASAQRFFGSGFNQGTVTATASVVFPVEMRTRPTALEQSGTASDYAIAHGFGVETAMNAVPTFGTYTTNRAATINGTVASGLTAGQGSFIISNGSNAYLGWSAEL